MTDVSSDTLALAAKIKPTLEKAGGGVFIAPADMWKQHLPAELTPESVEAVLKYRQELICASAHALGEVGIEEVRKDKTIDKVSLEYNFGAKSKKQSHDVVELAIRTRTENINPQDKDGAKIINHGVLSAAVTVQSGRGKVGQLAQVKAGIKSMYAEVFN